MSFVDFLLEYYVYILIVLVVIIVGVIGFLADSNRKKAKKNTPPIDAQGGASNDITVNGNNNANSSNNAAVNNSNVQPAVSGETAINTTAPVTGVPSDNFNVGVNAAPVNNVVNNTNSGVMPAMDIQGTPQVNTPAGDVIPTTVNAGTGLNFEPQGVASTPEVGQSVIPTVASSNSDAPLGNQPVNNTSTMSTADNNLTNVSPIANNNIVTPSETQPIINVIPQSDNGIASITPVNANSMNNADAQAPTVNNDSLAIPQQQDINVMSNAMNQEQSAVNPPLVNVMPEVNNGSAIDNSSLNTSGTVIPLVEPVNNTTNSNPSDNILVQNVTPIMETSGVLQNNTSPVDSSSNAQSVNGNISPITATPVNTIAAEPIPNASVAAVDNNATPVNVIPQEVNVNTDTQAVSGNANNVSNAPLDSNNVTTVQGEQPFDISSMFSSSNTN